MVHSLNKMLDNILKDSKLGLPNTFKFGPETKLNDVLSDLFIIIIYLAGFLAFFWFVWGAFQYIFAGGDKEKLARARARITWSIVGFIIVLLSFTLSTFVARILKLQIIYWPFG